MENTLLLETIIQQGAWASLFVVLFIWVLKDHARREKAYHATIDKLTEKFGKLDDSVKELTARLRGGKSE